LLVRKHMGQHWLLLPMKKVVERQLLLLLRRLRHVVLELMLWWRSIT
jgi:hypothetical protein